MKYNHAIKHNGKYYKAGEEVLVIDKTKEEETARLEAEAREKAEQEAKQKEEEEAAKKASDKKTTK